MSRKISAPAVRINDELVSIVPNSFVYDGGEGEVTVSASSAGAGNSSSVHAENAETQISMCKFSVFLVDDLDAQIRLWKNNVGINEIKATESGGRLIPVVRIFPNMSLVNKVDREASADGTVELEFQGDRMTIQ